MKNLSIIYFVLITVIFSCSQPKEKNNQESEKQADLAAKSPDKVAVKAENINSAIYGYYVGMFKASIFDRNKKPSYSNKITVSIDSMKDKIVYGHSIVAGNWRPFQGEWFHQEDVLQVNAKEPGDDRYDGAFEFSIYPESQMITGIWIANDENLAVTQREYTLEKRIFTYNPNLELPEFIAWRDLYDQNNEIAGGAEFLTEDVLKVNASNKLLKKEDVENLYKGDLEVIRNSIYARHGYSFKNRKIRYVFDSSVDWYMPVSVDIRDKITELEWQNIELIKRYEEHATAYYDTFGR
jgi:hypothetical protein